jgi:DNA-binding response OmpR family regulator
LADELQRELAMPDSPVSRLHLVLLVDDDLRTSRRMAEMLREDGFAVEIARDGAAAVARLARFPLPDAIVTELNTAHADGTAISHFARARNPHMPIIVATGYPHLFHAADFGSEAPLVFTKPVDYGSLRDTLRAALRDNPLPAATGAEIGPEPKGVRLESTPQDDTGNALSGAQAVRAVR